MIGWLYRMIIGRFGCDHKWKTVRVVPLEKTIDGRLSATGVRAYLRCEKCGDYRKRDMA